jgi:transcriptional regulator with XRE-family HTH domain
MRRAARTEGLSFANRLSMAMEILGVSSKEMSNRTGLSQSNISHITCGRREPSLANLSLIIQALDCDSYWLITGIKRT